MSDDGRHALTIIAFIGSVFSPYYAAARRRGAGDPEHHVALNVALYDLAGGGSRWTMTERGRSALARNARELVLGPSRLAVDGNQLRFDIDEVTAPIPRRVRGRVIVTLPALGDQVFLLDPGGHHRWQPLAPRAAVAVDLDAPDVRWRGHAYVDSNDGDRPLESDFSDWTWSRAAHGDATSTVLYDVTTVGGAQRSLALRFDARGIPEPLPLLPRHTLAPTRWRVARPNRSDDANTRVVHTLEDAPFYARSIVRGPRYGDLATTMHESLSLTRFSRHVVQWMLPFRMPRRARWGGSRSG